jgi:hypothetical protein
VFPDAACSCFEVCKRLTAASARHCLIYVRNAVGPWGFPSNNFFWTRRRGRPPAAGLYNLRCLRFVVIRSLQILQSHVAHKLCDGYTRVMVVVVKADEHDLFERQHVRAALVEGMYGTKQVAQIRCERAAIVDRNQETFGGPAVVSGP